MSGAPIFITGAQRSGTTLLEKLLGAQDGVSLLSQPLPLLFSEVKDAFLGERGLPRESYPLGHLFLEDRYERSAFATYLRAWRSTEKELESQFLKMADYSGQYSRFAPAQIAHVLRQHSGDDDFADTLSGLLRDLAHDPSAPRIGSKETICEEYVPYLLDRGFSCAIILRDPRDMLASLNHGRGLQYGGQLKPTLFNVRSWRKSVAFALAAEGHPRFHRIRYEDLAVDPENELHRLAALFDLSPVPRDARVPRDLRDASGRTWMGNSSHTEHHHVSASSIGSHRDHLPEEVSALVEAACLPEMQLLGYPTVLSRTAAVKSLKAFREPYTILRTGMAADMATEANASLEVERLERVSADPDTASSRWFLFSEVHRRLHEAFVP